jgi:hypothetical protein
MAKSPTRKRINKGRSFNNGTKFDSGSASPPRTNMRSRSIGVVPLKGVGMRLRSLWGGLTSMVLRLFRHHSFQPSCAAGCWLPVDLGIKQQINRRYDRCTSEPYTRPL